MSKTQWILLVTVLCAGGGLQVAYTQQSSSGAGRSTAKGAEPQALVNQYCVGCHSTAAHSGDLVLEGLDLADPAAHPETFERVIRKLNVGAMPPQGMPRPSDADLKGLVSYLETSIDQAAAKNPNPGRVSMHRLNRAEYSNAVRDLLDLQIDATALLPADDESSGFDNIADVLRMSPVLMERYLSASWNISRLAVGNKNIAPETTVYRAEPDLSQDHHLEGMPLGTVGGLLAKHNFPLDGEYEIKVRMWRNTFDLQRGIEEPHTIEIAVDGKRVKSATAGGKEDFTQMAMNPGEFGIKLDEALTVRVPLTAGVHDVTTYVLPRSHAKKDSMVKPFVRTTIDGLDLIGEPSVDRLSIEGPFQPTGVSETPSRRKIFTCRPATQAEEVSCAREILGKLARQAYRRPLVDEDLETLLTFYQKGRNRRRF